jgi:hypothetical protein
MADTDQHIQRFYEVARARDFSRDFQFRVLSITPGGTQAAGKNKITFNADDLVYLKTATLPGKTMQVHNVPYMGLNFHIPGSVNYTGSEGWQVTFYCDMASHIRQVFEDYMQNVFDDQTSTGAFNIPDQTSTIDLVQLNTQLEVVANYKLIGVFPVSIGDLNYQVSDGTGNAVEFQASLAYQYWRRADASTNKGLLV